MMLRQGAQEVPGIKGGARVLSPIVADLGVKDSLNGLTDKRRREGINVPSLRGDAARPVASSHNSLDQEPLCRKVRFVNGLWVSVQGRGVRGA